MRAPSPPYPPNAGPEGTPAGHPPSSAASKNGETTPTPAPPRLPSRTPAGSSPWTPSAANTPSAYFLMTGFGPQFLHRSTSETTTDPPLGQKSPSPGTPTTSSPPASPPTGSASPPTPAPPSRPSLFTPGSAAAAAKPLYFISDFRVLPCRTNSFSSSSCSS